MHRHSPLSALVTLLLLCSQHTSSVAASSKDDTSNDVEPCTAINPANSNFYDLRKITVPPLVNHKKAHKDDRDESWHARGYDYGTNFTINFCAPVIESLKDVEGIKDNMTRNISAFYKVGSKTYSIGQTSTEPIFRGRKLVLNYTDGSPCDSSSSSSALYPRLRDSDSDKDDDDKSSKKKPTSAKPDPRRKSTLISFQCERDSLAPKAHISFIGASPDECTYFFEVKSMAACGGIVTTQQSVGPWGVFAVIGIIAAAAYVCGGVAYNRIVMHQRGWRQLPNYSLWAWIFGFFAGWFFVLTGPCAKFFPRRRGYSHLGNGRGRRDDEANGLIDSYDEEY